MRASPNQPVTSDGAGHMRSYPSLPKSWTIAGICKKFRGSATTSQHCHPASLDAVRFDTTQFRNKMLGSRGTLSLYSMGTGRRSKLRDLMIGLFFMLYHYHQTKALSLGTLRNAKGSPNVKPLLPNNLQVPNVHCLTLFVILGDWFSLFF